MHRSSCAALAASAVAAITWMAPAYAATYQIDPSHTYPSFEADHMGGMSVWRGKFRKTSGTIEYDRASARGSVEITVDTASVDFGLDLMNKHARSDEIFDVAKYPTAVYKGRLAEFKGDVPGAVDGMFTLHGVTKPLRLEIKQFKCAMNPFLKAEVCGADALATFDRSEFGVDAGKDYGFKQEVTLRIQVEAVKKP